MKGRPHSQVEHDASVSRADPSVLLVQESFLPLLGGAELHVLKLGQALQRIGFRVTVLTATPGPSMWDGLPVVRMPFLDHQGRLSPVTRPLGLLLLRHLVRTHTVVHAHYTEMMASIVGELASSMGVPFLITLHGHGTLDSAVLGSPRAERWRRLSFSFANTVIATTPEMRAIAERFVDSSRVIDVTNGVDTRRLSFTPRRNRGSLHLLTLRRLVPKNGVQYLIEAMPMILDAVPDATLTVAGTGTLDGYLKERVTVLGLENRVQFVGAYDNDSVGTILRDADIVVFPSSAEGFSLAALEAMAVGRIVVASSLGGFLDMLAEGRGILVPLFDREVSDYNAPLELDRDRYLSLATSIVGVWHRPDQMDDIAQRAAAWVRAEYSWDIIARSVADAYSCQCP